tara:strand:- start:2205 stop:2363 length:159 start_codon:yes stop_codon:yes gene_type:complete
MKKFIPRLAYVIAFFLPLLTLEFFDNYKIGVVPALLIIFFLWKNNYFPINKS